MNLKSRFYADNTTNLIIIDYSDLVRQIFYEGVYNANALFVDGDRVLNKYDAYSRKIGKFEWILSIVFRGEYDTESMTLCYEKEQLSYVNKINLGILDRTLKEMKESGEFQQLLGLLYL